MAGQEIAISLGEMGEARGRIVTSEPSRRFAFVETGWMDGAPPLLTEFEIENLGENRCRLRIVNRVDGESVDRTRAALAAAEAAWRDDLVALQSHLAG